MIELPSFESLRRYVCRVLCDRADVVPATPLLETPLYRRGRPCGIEFTLLCPRTTRLSAIWETFEHRVLFYDQDLVRFQVTQVRGPELADLDQHLAQDPAVRSLWAGK
jgi:hypothetical protein